MRDLVIGVTVVLAGGMVASSGGKVVKNVAGYDLGKLFSGSRGRLGLIARVALRLHPRPAAVGDGRVRDARTRGRSGRSSAALSSSRPRSTSSRRAGSRCCFEGRAAAVDAQVAACPGRARRRRRLGRRARARQAGRGGP